METTRRNEAQEIAAAGRPHNREWRPTTREGGQSIPRLTIAENIRGNAVRPKCATAQQANKKSTSTPSAAGRESASVLPEKRTTAEGKLLRRKLTRADFWSALLMRSKARRR